MCYVKELLRPGESVTYEADMSYWPLVLVWTASLMVAPILLFAADGLSAGDAFALRAAAATLALVLLAQTVAWYRAELAVTEKRVLATTGLVPRRRMETDLATTCPVRVKQGTLGRFFDFGQVSVGDRVFHAVESPFQVQKNLLRAMQGAAA